MESSQRSWRHLPSLVGKELTGQLYSSPQTLQWNLSNTDTLGPIKCVLISIGRFPHFRGQIIHTYMKLGLGQVSWLGGCPHFRGRIIHIYMKLGLGQVSWLGGCPHFRGRIIHTYMKLGLGQVSWLGGCPQCSPCTYPHASNSWCFVPHS